MRLLLSAILRFLAGLLLGSKTGQRLAKTHDYRRNFWGWACENLTGHRWYGFGFGVQKGDYVLLRERDSVARYRVLDIEYKDDPRDMWMATLKPAAPLKEGEPIDLVLRGRRVDAVTHVGKDGKV